MSWPAQNRWWDHVIIVFYIIAFLVIWLIEIEQVVIGDPENFNYPIWPPRYFVDLTHWWGDRFHGALYHRPAWYKLTIWYDLIFSWFVYLAGIYAFAKRKAWIKWPAIIQAAGLFIIVIYSAWQEVFGIYATEGKYIVLASMIPWAVVPGMIVRRCLSIERQSVKNDTGEG